MMGETICYYIETFISGLFLKPFLLEPLTALRNHFFFRDSAAWLSPSGFVGRKSTTPDSK